MTLPSNKSSVIAGSLQEYDTIAIRTNRFDLFIVLKMCNKYCVKSRAAVRFQENSHPLMMYNSHPHL
jgi:hypothetical protein